MNLETIARYRSLATGLVAAVAIHQAYDSKDTWYWWVEQGRKLPKGGVAGSDSWEFPASVLNFVDVLRKCTTVDDVHEAAYRTRVSWSDTLDRYIKTLIVNQLFSNEIKLFPDNNFLTRFHHVLRDAIQESCLTGNHLNSMAQHPNWEDKDIRDYCIRIANTHQLVAKERNKAKRSALLSQYAVLPSQLFYNFTNDEQTNTLLLHSLACVITRVSVEGVPTNIRDVLNSLVGYNEHQWPEIAFIVASFLSASEQDSPIVANAAILKLSRSYDLEQRVGLIKGEKH